MEQEKEVVKPEAVKAEAAKPAEKEAPKKATKLVAPAPGVKVKALVNMSLHDGTQLTAGQVCQISEEEYARLKKDERGPFFAEGK